MDLDNFRCRRAFLGVTSNIAKQVKIVILYVRSTLCTQLLSLNFWQCMRVRLNVCVDIKCMHVSVKDLPSLNSATHRNRTATNACSAMIIIIATLALEVVNALA